MSRSRSDKAVRADRSVSTLSVGASSGCCAERRASIASCFRSLRMAGLFHQISQAADGADRHSRSLDLAPQAMHEDLDRIGSDLIAHAIQTIGELILAHDPAR